MSFLDLFKINYYKSEITRLNYQIETSDNDILSLKDKISDLEDANNNKITQMDSFLETIQQLKDKLKQIEPLFDSELASVTKHDHDSLMSTWALWNISQHDTFPQLKRQERAKDAIVTPLSIDYPAGKGIFRGKQTDYLTTLLSCECIDHKRHLLPCKHIYRLAHELDVYHLDEVQYHPDIKSVLKVEQLKNTLINLPAKSKELFSDVLYNTYKHCSNDAIVKNLCNLSLIKISNNKQLLLQYFTKDTLLNFFEDSNKPKSLKKADLIDFIIHENPQIIDAIEKINVVVELHDSISHLKYYIDDILK